MIKAILSSATSVVARAARRHISKAGILQFNLVSLVTYLEVGTTDSLRTYFFRGHLPTLSVARLSVCCQISPPVSTTDFSFLTVITLILL
jgi:hypothetical protein